MDLILWRHAEAEDGFPDQGRVLTEKGKKQAELIAAWLKKRIPGDCRIMASPAKRTRQTASALGLEFSIENAIGTGAGAREVLAACGWPDKGGTVLLIGHQPTLGQIASLLLCGEESDLTVKKGGLWWFSRRERLGENQVVLRAVISPDLL